MIEVVQPETGIVSVALSGEIDVANADEVADRVRRSLPRGTAGVILDLSRLEYLDSTGVRALFELARSFEGSSGRIVAVAPTDAPVRPVLDVSGLAGAIAVHPTTGAARAALGPAAPAR